MVTEGEAIENNFKKLGADRLDFVETIDITALILLKKIFKSKSKDYGMTPLPDFSVTASLVIGDEPKNQKMIKQFIKGLAIIKKNKTYIKILEKFHGKGKVPQDIIIN